MGKIDMKLGMISGIAFLRPILQSTGCDIDLGIILKFDNDHKARTFGKKFTDNLNGKSIRNVEGVSGVKNFECAVYYFKGNENLFLLNDFLMEDKFLPIVLSGSKLPSSMREEQYIIRFDGEDIENTVEEFTEYYQEFVNFVKKYPDYIKKNILHMKTTNIMMKHAVDEEFQNAYRCLLAVGFVWKIVIYNKRTEKDAEDFWDDYLLECKKITDKFGDYPGRYEIEDEISDLVWEFMKTHNEIRICSAEEVSTKGQESIKTNETILFDHEFYFIPEKLVKKICTPFLDIMSVHELKEALKKCEIIQCNEDGFTVKKKYWTSTGTCDRMRAMKIKKETLMSSEGLLLEDVFEDVVADNHKSMEEGVLCQLLNI